MRKGRTLNCEVCFEPYTDNIDPRVDVNKGGYIICPYCAMKPVKKKVDIDPRKLIDAIQSRKLSIYRKELELTQDDLAERLGIKRRQYYKMEKGQYLPTDKTLRKFERKIKHVTLHAA